MAFDYFVREAMRYIYPILAGTTLCLMMLEIVWYRRVAPTPIRLARAVIWLLIFLTTALLSVSAGSEPLFSINELRPYIALLRFVTMLAMLVAIWIMLRPLIRIARKEGG